LANLPPPQLFMDDPLQGSSCVGVGFENGAFLGKEN